MTSCDCCGKCAYLDKSTKKLWCPFHDEPVSSNMVCDHFLDEHESPQWASLISGMSKNENKETIKQFTGKDCPIRFNGLPVSDERCGQFG